MLILLSVLGNSGISGINHSSNLVGEERIGGKNEKREELKRDTMNRGGGYSAVSTISDRLEFAEIASSVEAAGGKGAHTPGSGLAFAGNAPAVSILEREERTEVQRKNAPAPVSESPFCGHLDPGRNSRRILSLA